MSLDIFGRLPAGLLKLLNSTGPESVDSMNSQLQPVVDVEGSLPERAFTRSEKLFQMVADVTGIAANNPGVTITLPANTGVITIVEQIEVELIAVPGIVVVFAGNLPNAGTPVAITNPFRDLRNTQPAASAVQSSTAYANPPFNACAWHSFVVGETWKVPGPWIISPAVPGQTNGIAVAGAVNTQRIIVNLTWRERPVTLQELNAI